MFGFFGFFGYGCAFLKDLMFYVFGDIGFLGTVAQFRVGHTSERSREPLPDYVDPLGLSPGPPGLFCTLLRCLLDPLPLKGPRLTSRWSTQAKFTAQGSKVSAADALADTQHLKAYEHQACASPGSTDSSVSVSRREMLEFR